MPSIRSLFPRPALLWLVFALGLGVIGQQAWSVRRQEAVARASAEALLAGLDNDARVSAEEYGAWKQLAAADSDVRIAAVKLMQEARYVPLLRHSGDLLGRTVIGADRDGTMSRLVAEDLLCSPLEGAPATSNDELPFYLVPWLNPAALDSLSCADILTNRLLSSAPGNFTAGANLLALVLAALPAEQAQPFIGTIVERAAGADANAVSMLFSALRHVRGADYPTEFATALRTLTERFAAAARSAEIASLFRSIDFLKYSVTPDELVPVLEAGIGQMLARNDDDLTRDIYFTLTDLKTSHPDVSFGRRADYLMRGINIYSDALEIYDYSRVLALDEQYPGQDAVIALELLNGIRTLDADNYLSRIVPYCKRFMESSVALDYADFLPGAQLLVEQLHNESFIFQRPCLLDSGLVARIAPADRGALAEVVVEALANMSGPGASDRVAEAIELLGALGSELDSAQMAKLAELITAMAGTEADNWGQTKIVRAATAAANLDFPPEFYSELFVLLINATELNGSPAAVPPAFLDKLSDAQRAYVVSAVMSTLAALAAPLEDAASLAEQTSLLLVLRPWLSAADVDQAANLLMAALEDARSIPVFSQLAGALIAIKPQMTGQPALRRVWLEHLVASNDRAELAELFNSAGRIGAIRGNDAAGQAAVRAAAIRFLEQIVPDDARAGAVRAILIKAPGESTLPQITAPVGSSERADQTRARTRAISQRTRGGSRIVLEAGDIERLAARYIRALSEERVSHPISDYALSLGTLAAYSRPGELDGVLKALNQRLDASAEPASHETLVAAWIAVEKATNAQRSPEQRIPLYQAVLQLPLTNAASRALLVAEAGQIAEQDFAGNAWKLLAWEPSAP